MQGSVHKKIIFAGFGCAGVFVILAAIGFLLAPRSEFEHPTEEPLFAPLQASAARDSLQALRSRFAAPRRIAADRPDTTAWRLALFEMRTERPLIGIRALPYGDTFPASTDERKEWIESADWRAVLVLLGRAAARGDRGDTAQALDQMDANLLLSVARALHARARSALTAPPRLDEASAAERAAISIGRGLEGEPDLVHVLLGARVLRDARQFLATVPALSGRLGVRDPAAALARGDSDLIELRAVRRWMPVAGSLAANAAALASWARNTALLPAVRREAVEAIAYGWVFNTREPLYGLGSERADALAALAALDLPAPVAAAVRDGQAVQRLGVAQRFARSVEYRTARDETPRF